MVVVVFGVVDDVVVGLVDATVVFLTPVEAAEDVVCNAVFVAVFV